MKYKTGKKNMIAVYAEMKSPPSDLLAGKNNSIETGTFRISTKPNIFGYLKAKDCPCLLKNILSLLYVTLLAFAKKYGTRLIVKTKNISARIGIKLANKSIKVALMLMPSQNIKFQKLSLFKRDLIKFMVASILKLMIIINSQIIAQFKTLLQIITAITLIFTSFLSVSNCFANDLLPLINKTEQEYHIPTGLLLAIANVESTIKPYALNIGGRAIFAKSKAEAVEIVRYHLDQGRDNIDLGVMQINLYWHGKNFADIEQMLTPKNNIEYAAKFLTKLYEQHGSWNLAIRYYHSAKSEQHNKYARKILVSWLSS